MRHLYMTLHLTNNLHMNKVKTVTTRFLHSPTPWMSQRDEEWCMRAAALADGPTIRVPPLNVAPALAAWLRHPGGILQLWLWEQSIVRHDIATPVWEPGIGLGIVTCSTTIGTGNGSLNSGGGGMILSVQFSEFDSRYLTLSTHHSFKRRLFSTK